MGRYAGQVNKQGAYAPFRHPQVADPLSGASSRPRKYGIAILKSFQ
jgi:hypothetical protein